MVLIVLLPGCAGYFAPTLSDYQQPIMDPAQCAKYNNLITAPSWFNALALPETSGVQTSSFLDIFLLAANGGSTGALNQNTYERCVQQIRNQRNGETVMRENKTGSARTPPNWQMLENGKRIKYYDRSGMYLGESVNRNGVTMHYNSSGNLVYTDKCLNGRCTRTDSSGRTVQTWVKNR